MVRRRFVKLDMSVFALSGWIVAAVLLGVLIFNYFSPANSYLSMPMTNIPGSNGFVPGVGGGPPTNPNEPSTQQVSLQSIPIRKIINSRVMWVGPSETEEVLLVLNNQLIPDSNLSSLSLKVGQNVDLEGVIKVSPDPSQSEQRWGLSPDDANTLSDQQYYLLVSKISQH